jgi:hypothetical protein
MTRPNFTNLESLALGLPWYESPTGESMAAYVTVTWDDGTTAEGTIRGHAVEWLGSCRDRAFVARFGEGHHVILGGLTSGAKRPWCRRSMRKVVGRLAFARRLTIRLGDEAITWCCPLAT